MVHFWIQSNPESAELVNFWSSPIQIRMDWTGLWIQRIDTVHSILWVRPPLPLLWVYSLVSPTATVMLMMMMTAPFRDLTGTTYDSWIFFFFTSFGICLWKLSIVSVGVWVEHWCYLRRSHEINSRAVSHHSHSFHFIQYFVYLFSHWQAIRKSVRTPLLTRALPHSWGNSVMSHPSPSPSPGPAAAAAAAAGYPQVQTVGPTRPWAPARSLFPFSVDFDATCVSTASAAMRPGALVRSDRCRDPEPTQMSGVGRNSSEISGMLFFQIVDVHLFPTNFGQSACNSVKVQPISTLRLPNHARPAAELPNRRNCLHYFRNACTVA